MGDTDSLSKATDQHSLAAEAAQAKTEVSNGLIIFFSTIIALIGVWSAACLVSGLAASGSILSFIKVYFTSVIGS